MQFLEKDLEDIIWSSSPRSLTNKGFPYPVGFDARFRQSKIGNYGISDIIFIKYNHKKRKCHITVCELKKDKLDTSSFLQAIRYCKGLSQFISIRHNDSYRCSFDIILCGREVSLKDEFAYLTDLVKGKVNLKVITYDYTLNGLTFTRKERYKLVDNGFKEGNIVSSKEGYASNEYISFVDSLAPKCSKYV